MSKEAMKLALDALIVCRQSNYGRNWYWPDTAIETALNNVFEAIKALEESLAKQEQHTLSSRVNDVRVHIEHGKQHDEAMKLITAKQEQGEPVLEVVDGKINRTWDAIPDGFTGLLYMQPQLTIPPKKPQEPWHGSARVDDYNRGWNECIDSIYTTPQQRTWVELTDEEMEKAMEYWSDKSRSAYGGAYSADEEYVSMVSTWRYIEAKLKQKNGYAEEKNT